MARDRFLPGFPEGALSVGKSLSILTKDGMVTYFVGTDNYFSHPEGDEPSRRFALATLMDNGHVRPRDLESPPLAIPKRTLMNYLKQLREKGHGSFFRPRPQRGKPVMTPEVVQNCAKYLSDGMPFSDIAKEMGIEESTLRKGMAKNPVISNPKKKQGMK